VSTTPVVPHSGARGATAPDGFTADERRHMARALELAALGLYSTDPNPRVGCVLVRDGEVVGEGWHAKAGEPHAEVHALHAAGERARGATAFVTLEPCAHHGRTPPCADALVAAGVARVVYAVGDPFPAVNGAGAARLAAAGVAVAHGCLRAEAEALNRGFFRRLRTGRPFVTLKLAASLDGRTALANGESRWITGDAARADVQRLRARSSAVLSGAGTVNRDGARLTVRDDSLDLRGRRPLRVVLDPRRQVPPEAPLFREPGPVLVLVRAASPSGSPSSAAPVVRAAAPPGAAAEPPAGVEVLELPAGEGGHGLDLAAVLAELARRHVNELLVEAGPRLAGAWLRSGLVDELVLYLAPHLLGPDAKPLAELPPLESLAARRRFAWREATRVGEDLKLVLAPDSRGTLDASES
jgi:diaminohydroxyphosphoribosylaminopyrimidine deaminase/5-amino-6-(5-phosphoribosylamino)uracil reductase